ncbi:MAG: glycosyltransferase [Bacteroidia bacterium]|nr:glycosyltransferase [Bacteroidia bacterium]MCZ2278100.1 glycosyltransferase [Bacteroidia bacterium]
MTGSEKTTQNRPVMVSICCLTYNHENHIKKALDGFLMQKTDFPYEIVIHDDASTDGTAQVIREYEQKYPAIFKTLYQTENQKSKFRTGMNQRFNFPRATGKYIALCEGDDYWIDPYKLQKQVAFLEQHPDYGLIHTDAKKYDLKTGVLWESDMKKYHPGKRANLLDALFACEYPVFTCTAVFRRELAEYAAQFKNEFAAGDYFMWFHLVAKTKFKFLPEVTAVRQVLEESATQSKNIENAINFWNKDYEMYLFFIKYYKYDNQEIIRLMKRVKRSSSLNRIFYSGCRPYYRQFYDQIKEDHSVQLPFKFSLYYILSFIPFSFTAINRVLKWVRVMKVRLKS